MIEPSQAGKKVVSHQARGMRPDEGELLALGQALRTLLRFHQLSGIERYPAGAVLRSPAMMQQPLPASAAITAPRPTPAPSRSTSERPPVAAVSSPTWQEMQEHLRTCELCPLATDRQGQVPGRGSTSAPLLVVGDYAKQPDGCKSDCLFGQEEDRMLNNMMLAIGCQPETVYVTNILKCCPQPGVMPAEDCYARCLTHLKAEVALVRPRVILAMGEIAMAALLGGGDSVVLRRGRFHPYRPDGPAGAAIPVMVTFHPRWLLSNPDLKMATWKDLQMIQRQLRTS